MCSGDLDEKDRDRKIAKQTAVKKELEEEEETVLDINKVVFCVVFLK